MKGFKGGWFEAAGGVSWRGWAGRLAARASSTSSSISGIGEGSGNLITNNLTRVFAAPSADSELQY